MLGERVVRGERNEINGFRVDFRVCVTSLRKVCVFRKQKNEKEEEEKKKKNGISGSQLNFSGNKN